MEKCVLSLVGADSPELYETYFRHPLIAEEKRSIRGRESGAYQGYNTFQWTRAVQALCVLFLRTLAHIRDDARTYAPPGPILAGEAGSLAASLDYAIDKQTAWLMDMFGCDAHGVMLAGKIIARSNPRKRRRGPVALSLNPRFLPLSKIEVQLNFAAMTKPADLQLLAFAVEKSCRAIRHFPLLPRPEA